MGAEVEAAVLDETALEEAYQRALAEHYAGGRAGMRSKTATIALMAMALTFACIPLWPFAERLLGVGVDVTLPIAALSAAFILHATLAFHRAGALSPWYRIAERLESVVSVGAALALILASGSSVSVFWLLFVMFIADTANNGYDVEWSLAVYGVSTAALAMLFGIGGQVEDAGITLALGVFGGCTIWALGVSVRRRLRAEAERALLRDKLSGVLVERERDRIARDLHDGVAADLSALVWRARALKAQMGAPGAADVVDDLVSDAKRSLDDLRDVVGAMSGASQDWRSFTEELAARVAGLASGVLAHEVVCVDEEGAVEVPVETRVQVLRIVQEAVQNAARHAHASAVRVELSRGSALELRISDDGIGIAAEISQGARGGLRNIERRARSLGGDLVVLTRSDERRGAELAITIPL